MESFLLGIGCGVFVTSLVGIFVCAASYRNGVTDGYGFSREPWNRGYRCAKDFLVRSMSHRWPELRIYGDDPCEHCGDPDCHCPTLHQHD